jgi:hypothetical protein
MQTRNIALDKAKSFAQEKDYSTTSPRKSSIKLLLRKLASFWFN